MSTLKELIEKYGFGKKFEVNSHVYDGEAIPLAYSVNDPDRIVVEYADKSLDSWMPTSTGWSLYEEPKKKIKKWLWAYKENKEWFMSARYFSDEPTGVYRAECNPIKLEWSEIEVSE